MWLFKAMLPCPFHFWQKCYSFTISKIFERFLKYRHSSDYYLLELQNYYFWLWDAVIWKCGIFESDTTTRGAIFLRRGERNWFWTKLDIILLVRETQFKVIHFSLFFNIYLFIMIVQDKIHNKVFINCIMSYESRKAYNSFLSIKLQRSTNKIFVIDKKTASAIFL